MEEKGTAEERRRPGQEKGKEMKERKGKGREEGKVSVKDFLTYFLKTKEPSLRVERD